MTEKHSPNEAPHVGAGSGVVMGEVLTETSEGLCEALSVQVGRAVGLERVESYAYHTGGGCMVALVDLSQDGRGLGRQLWLTREEGWTLGFYDFLEEDHEDGYGVCVRLLLSGQDADDAEAVAAAVAGIVSRLGGGLQG